MLKWRQKVLIQLLGQVPTQNVSKIRLVKWSFLLKEEEAINQFGSFYDFVPYKYGPFSFLLYRELAELERYGFIRTQGDNILLNYELLENRDFALKPQVDSSIKKIVGNYSNMSKDKLIDYVYNNYPWFATRSEIRENGVLYSMSNQPAIYTLGYEGLSIDAFLNVVLQAGIQVIIDSRSNPASRKYGFSKYELARKCKDMDLVYLGFSDVGISSQIRRSVQDENDLWDHYRQDVLPKVSTTINRIATICQKDPSVLICFEKYSTDCHRRILAAEISDRTGLPVLSFNLKENRWEQDNGS